MNLPTLLKSLNSSALRSNLTDIIKAVHNSHKPTLFQSLFSGGNSWRHESMKKTLSIITDQSNYARLSTSAVNNFNTWSQKKEGKVPLQVEVIPKDWGETVGQFTKRHGVLYTVLNMANSHYPGGAVMYFGGSAQEEDMWHRSTCALSLLEDGICFEKESNSFVYTPETMKYLVAQAKMTSQERELVVKRGSSLSVQDEPHKVLFCSTPRICFRGPEVRVIAPVQEFSAEYYLADPNSSYAMSTEEEIFPFFELRSAAPENVTGITNAKEQQQYLIVLRRGVAAQLDTLILENLPYVILGALGLRGV